MQYDVPRRNAELAVTTIGLEGHPAQRPRRVETGPLPAELRGGEAALRFASVILVS